MKKTIFISLVLLFLSGVLLFAETSEMFVKTMPITKIYTHRLGFKVLYLKTDLTFGEMYVPLKWFDEAGGKGVLIRGTDPAYPYFSIFWKNGEFHSIKLYVINDFRDETWGSLKLPPDQVGEFDIDTLELDF